MSVIEVKVTDQVLKVTSAPTLASGGVNETTIKFTFCEKWDGYLKTAVFYRDPEVCYNALLDENDTCVLPWEVYAEPGTFYFSVFGNKDSIRRTSATAKYKVSSGLPGENAIPSDPTPSVYEQIIASIKANEESVRFTEQELDEEQKAQARENIGVVGKATEDGGVILTDCDSKHRAGNGAIAAGFRIDRADAPSVPAESDWRYNEAIGTGSVANGMGAVAYSRASKSLGYRTQTGYPPNAEEAEKRPEAMRYEQQSSSDPLYPADNVGQAAIAIGADTVAVGNHSFAGGYMSQAICDNSFAFGRNAFAKAIGAIAIGYGESADGVHSVALGENTAAISANSIAIGKGAQAKNAQAISIGNETIASGVAAVAMGQKSEATGAYSFAVSTGKAQGQRAIALGASVASADNAFAANSGNYAEHRNSAVFGRNNKSSRNYQTTVGEFNAPNNTAVFVVGNGTADTKRKNAFTVDYDGSAQVSGKLTFGDVDEASAKKVAQASVRLDDFTPGDFLGQIMVYDDAMYRTAYIWLGAWEKIAEYQHD